MRNTEGSHYLARGRGRVSLYKGLRSRAALTLATHIEGATSPSTKATKPQFILCLRLKKTKYVETLRNRHTILLEYRPKGLL